MRRWQLVALWLVVVVGATAVTWQIVSFADDRLGPSDTTPLEVEGPSSTAGTSPPTSSTVPAPSTTTGPTPTSTTTAPQSDLMSVPTEGGTVTVRVAPGAITLVSVDPAPGFTTEIDEAGPPEVRVELTSGDTEVEVRVRWRDGRVDVEIGD